MNIQTDVPDSVGADYISARMFQVDLPMQKIFFNNDYVSLYVIASVSVAIHNMTFGLFNIYCRLRTGVDCHALRLAMTNGGVWLT